MALLLTIGLALGSLALVKTLYNRWQLAVVDRAIAAVEIPTDHPEDTRSS